LRTSRTPPTGIGTSNARYDATVVPPPTGTRSTSTSTPTSVLASGGCVI